MPFCRYRNDVLFLGLFVVLSTTLSTPAVAQTPEPEIDIETTTRVTLGKSAAQPNETALIPIYLVPPKSIPISRVKFNVTFVSANVKFDKVEPGPIIDVGKVKFSTEVSLGKNENGVETSTVTVVGEVPEQSAEGLPAGLFVYLSLRLSAEARPANITLRTSASEATRLGSAEPLPDVRTFDAQLEVQAPGYSPTVVCFFFNH